MTNGTSTESGGGVVAPTVFVSDYQSQYNAWLAKTHPSPLLQGFTHPAVPPPEIPPPAPSACAGGQCPTPRRR